MKKVSLLVLALVLMTSAVFAVSASNAPKLREKNGIEADPIFGPKMALLPGKDAGDLIITNVHNYSCYISTVRPLDMDLNYGAAFLYLRNSLGTLSYIGTEDGGANWTLFAGITGSIRYPSAMADVTNERPVAFYNWAWGDTKGEGCYTTFDDGAYNSGLWHGEVEIDTLGRKVSGTAYYCINGVMGSNDVYHCTANYWGDNTPDATFYFRSADYGLTWTRHDPRKLDLVWYGLYGVQDSLNIWKGPIVKDSITEQSVNQIHGACSADGNTVLMASCGNTPDTSVNSRVLFWYRISTDAGLTWTPFTWAPDPGHLWFDDPSWDVDVVLDKDGYPHFATYLPFDTTADGSDYGPTSGIYDYHQTATGWELTFITGAIDSLAGISILPGECNFALDPAGDLVLTFVSNYYYDVFAAGEICDVYITKSSDNGKKYGKPMKITDGTQSCQFAHPPLKVGGAGTQIPIYYQVYNIATTFGDGHIKWVNYDDIPDGVEGAPAPMPVYGFALNRNFPNPVNKATTFSFMLPRDSKYSLKVYNVAGQVVKSFEGYGKAGANSLPWNTNNVANGVYMYQLNAAGNTATQRLVIVK